MGNYNGFEWTTTYHDSTWWHCAVKTDRLSCYFISVIRALELVYVSWDWWAVGRSVFIRFVHSLSSLSLSLSLSFFLSLSLSPSLPPSPLLSLPSFPLSNSILNYLLCMLIWQLFNQHPSPPWYHSHRSRLHMQTNLAQGWREKYLQWWH